VTPSPARSFRLLALEALSDAVRRRIVPTVGVMALFSLLFVDSCTSCSPVVTRNGEALELPQIAGVGGLVGMLVLGLWTMVLAGVLASDHLAEPLADGSADLLLARPVSREAFALSRWAGAWLLAAATGALLLGTTALLLHVRQGLPLAPAALGYLACLAGAGSVAALAMTASLWWPRALTALVVFGGVWAVAWLEVARQLGAELSGAPGWLERFGPPLAGPILLALSAWIEPGTSPRVEPLVLGLRSLLWLAASLTALLLAFRRVELGR